MKNIDIQGENSTERNQWLKGILSKGTYDITFTKVNGEIRTMPCTLDARKLPRLDESKVSTKKKSDDTLSVWCVDKQEWRSFKVMNVTEIKEL